MAVAMNTGTQAAKEAGNMVDLDSNPTMLIEVVETGKQMLMTRGSLTTFSIANDNAQKYFAIIPAAFASTYPQLNALNVVGLASPLSAILSAVIFNVLIIVFLIPLALRGVKYRPLGASVLLRRNLLVYGLGGILIPFAGIKLIDVGLSLAHLVLNRTVGCDHDHDFCLASRNRAAPRDDRRHGSRLSAGDHGNCRRGVCRCRGRQSHRSRRQASGVAAHRAKLQRSRLFLEPAVRDCHEALQR